ncbi:MAG: CDP-glycerol glycerophosphotransferase family protein [Lachnospiraceae bacterium]|nr:CDP-glycerol glycerophosphotransferase family protein [Lachnospiraceae bacterium]
MTGWKNKFIKKIYRLFRLFPVKKKQILIFSYYGEQYSGSPKYISNYIEGKAEFDVVWAFTAPERYRDLKSKIVRYGHLNFYRCLATAGIIITNYRMTEEFVKRPGQKYIQTWHSSLRLKMIEKDAEDTLPVHYVEMAKNDSKQLDYLLAGSQKSKEIFERSFWYDGKIANTGTPQCDILFEDRNPVQNKVFQYYHIPMESHIVLYAPTFRKDYNLSPYDLNTEILIDSLRKRFGGEWYLLMRLHPHLLNQKSCFQYSDKVLQATDYDDVQELLCAADVLITDYSAIMFDFSVTKRPCFLYTPDFIEYTTKDRNLYFDVKKLPFASFERQEELFRHIHTFSEREYEKRINCFLSEIGSFDDGKACQRVYKLIKGENV